MNEGHGGPFGAVVVREGVIIGEICTIRDACSRMGSHVLAHYEIFTTGQPCPMCLGAIQ